MSLVVRTSVEPASLASAVRQAAAEVDQTQPLSNLVTMETLVSESVSQPRFNLFLLGLFGGLALLLAAAGIYGVMAYVVAARTNEIGVRMALGAQPRDVLRLVIGHAMKLALNGVVLGLGGAVWLTRWLQTLLFEVSATDPLTFAGGTMALLLAALLACWIPARRATKVDPLIALRYD
jgi:putative ABC transport system permease protein